MSNVRPDPILDGRDGTTFLIWKKKLNVGMLELTPNFFRMVLREPEGEVPLGYSPEGAVG